jgi:threonine/homoserine/homoserine lactone efflux protein
VTGIVSEITMVGFAFATSASPGPVNIIAVTAGARFGVQKNTSFVLGATISFCSILFLVGVGLGGILTSNKHLSNILAIVGSVYMLYLAYKLAMYNARSFSEKESSVPPNFIDGAMAQYLNPKAWIVSMSGVSIYVANQVSYTASLSIFIAIFFVVCFFSILGWVAAGKRLSSIFKNNIIIFNRIMALILFLSVLHHLVDIIL